MQKLKIYFHGDLERFLTIICIVSNLFPCFLRQWLLYSSIAFQE